MPTGWTIRALIWQRLHPMLPADVDRMPLSVIGALFNNHMVEPDAQTVAEAARIMETRMASVDRFQQARAERAAKRRRPKP